MPFIEPYADIEQELAPVMDTWRYLALNTSQADPVCCAPDWNLAFFSVFKSGRRIFYHYLENNLILLTEMRTVDGRVIMVPLEDSWMFAQPLLGFYTPEMFGLAAEELLYEYGQHPLIFMTGVQRQRPETTKLYSLYAENYRFFVDSSQTQCCASLAGGMDGWLSRRSANHRAKLRKAIKRAAKRGVVFERIRPSGVDEATAVFDRMIKIELKSWKGIGQCGMEEPASRMFYLELMKRLSRHGGAYVIFCRIEDMDIGFIFGSAAGLYYRGQQFSYVQEMADLSVGNLMQFEQIKWLCEEGFGRYDMGPITGPRMQYKEHWTEEKRFMETWILKHR